MKVRHENKTYTLTPGMKVQTACEGTFSAKPQFNECTIVDLLSTQFTCEDARGRIHYRLYQDVGSTWTP